MRFILKCELLIVSTKQYSPEANLTKRTESLVSHPKSDITTQPSQYETHKRVEG